MSRSSLSLILLLLKYAIKRKLNKIGYFYKKKSKSKSRNAIAKKGSGVFIKGLGIFVVLYFIAIATFLIYSYCNDYMRMYLFEQCLKNSALPVEKKYEASFRSSIDFHHQLYVTNKDYYEKQLQNLYISNRYCISNKFIEFINDRYEPDINPLKEINQNMNNILDVEDVKANLNKGHQYVYKCLYDMVQKNEANILSVDQLELTESFRESSNYINMIYFLAGFFYLFSICTAIGMSAQETGSINKYFEWLAFNGLPVNALFVFRTIENCFTNILNWTILLPSFLVIYFMMGGFYFLPLGIVVWLFYSILIGCTQTLLEILFQYYLPIKYAKFFQAIVNLGTTSIALSFSLISNNLFIKGILFQYTQFMHQAFSWIPFFYLPFIKKNNSFYHINDLLFFLIPFMLFAFIYYITNILTKNGLISQSENPKSERKKKEQFIFKNISFRGDPIIRFEKLLLIRNKQILITILLTPVIIFVFNSLSMSFRQETFLNPKHICSIAFSMCTYVFLFTTFQFAQREYKALPMIYTLPINPADYFFKKVNLWVLFSYLFFGLINGIYFYFGGSITNDYIINMVLVFIGVYVYGWISTGVGLIGFNPNEELVTRRMSQGYAYLYLFLVSIFLGGLIVDSLLIKLYVLILVIFLAFAFRIKVRELMQYYLDPTVENKSLTIFESILFVLFYISILTFVQVIMVINFKNEPYLFYSGLIATILFLLILFFSRNAYPEIKDIFKEIFKLRDSSFLSITSAFAMVVTVSIAGLYMLLVKKFQLFGGDLVMQMDFPIQYYLFAIFVAPFVEEILFRRLLFSAMKKYFSVFSSILFSSLIFAMAHPPSSFIPVFLLGAFSAIVFQKSKSIYQSIFLHMIYNACVLTIALSYFC